MPRYHKRATLLSHQLRTLSTVLAFVFGALCCAAAHLNAAPAAHPNFVQFDSEHGLKGTVHADSAAYKGHFVRTEGDWQPVIVADVPPESAIGAGSISVWIRSRGVALQLKTIDTAGKQIERAWAYEQPERWTWRSLGTYTRAEMGYRFLIIRGSSPTSTFGVDCVLLTSDKSLDPKSVVRDAPLAPIRVTIHWDKPVADASARAYSLNAYCGFNPAIPHDVKYRSAMTFMDPGMVRYHNWSMLNDSATDASGWIDRAHHCWDAARIKAALQGAYPGTVRLINIPSWPDWMDADKDGYLDANQLDNWSAFCADLVRIVNIRLNQRIQYFEITNERDGPYFGDLYNNAGLGTLKDARRPERAEELANIVVRASRAMKKVDPSIKVGGPATARPDVTEFDRRFIAAAAPDIDFYSWHGYASGSAGDGDDAIFDRTDTYKTVGSTIRRLLDAASPRRHIESILDEYNISWTWETRDPRMRGAKGGVFDALSMAAALNGGVDITMAWNECDGVFGKMDPSYALRPGASVFHLFNNYLVGTCVASSTDDEKAVAVLAVLMGGSTGRSIALINRSPSLRTVTIEEQGWTIAGTKQLRLANRQVSRPPLAWTFRVDETGLTGKSKIATVSTNIAGGRALQVETPPDSVTILTSASAANIAEGN